MRALAFVLVLAPAALASLAAPPPGALANGCTACECGVALCVGDAVYFLKAEITRAPDEVHVGEVFEVAVRLSLPDINGTPAPANVTRESVQLFLNHAYIDPLRPNDTPTMSGSVQLTADARYPGEYELPMALAVPGIVDVHTWTIGAQSEPWRITVLGAVEDETPADENGAPAPWLAVPLALATTSLVARRRR